MRRIYYILLVVASLLVACSEKTEPTITGMTVKVTAGEADVTELTFTVTSENATNCAWMCVKKTAAIPSGVDIMSKGRMVFANNAVSAKATELDDNTTYVIIAAAMNENNDIVTSEPVEMTTLEREAEPTVSLSAGVAQGKSYTFSYLPSDAVKCYYKLYTEGSNASIEDIIATGVEVPADEERNVTLTDLEDGAYFVYAVAVNGDKTYLSNKIIFTIDTVRPTYTRSILYAKINSSLVTNGRSWIVRFYYRNEYDELDNIAINFETTEGGHEYVPAGTYVFESQTGYKLVSDYTYEGWDCGFVDGYVNVAINDDKTYTFDIYLVRDNDTKENAGKAFTLNWTGTVENMPIL